MKLFVTGGTGFVGSHFINAATYAGYDVVALKRPGGKPRIPLIKEPMWIEGPLDGHYEDFFSTCDALVHFASAGVSPQPASWDLCFTENVNNSLKLWERAIDAGINKLLIAGTFAEYGKSGLRYELIPTDAPLEPIGAYASSKAASFVAAHGLAIEREIKFSYLRIFSAFGEGQYDKNLWPSLHKAAVEGRDYPMTNGEQVRDFISIEDVAKSFLKSLSFNGVENGRPAIKNIGSGKPQTVREFSEYWWKQWNAKGKLLPGAIPYRENEIMHYVPAVDL